MDALNRAPRVLVCVIAGVLLTFAITPLALGRLFDDLYSPLLTHSVRQHLQSDADDIADDIGPLIGLRWNIGLERFDHLYGVTLTVYDSHGSRLAGARSDPPLPVKEELSKTAALVTAEIPAAGSRAPLTASAQEQLREQRAHLLPLVFVFHDHRTEQYWIGIRTFLQYPTGELRSAAVLASSPSLWRALSFLGLLPWVFALTALVCVALSLPLLLSWWSARLLTVQTANALRLTRTAVPNMPLPSGDQRQMTTDLTLAATQLKDYREALSHFVADIAHEIIAALARLRLALEILKDQGQCDPELLVDVHNELDQLARLAVNLTAHWQVNLAEGRPPLSAQPLSAIVRSAATGEGAAGQVLVQVPEELVVWGRAELLQHALSNLIRNALKHAAPAQGPVEVDANADGNKVRLRVMDRGPGVPPSALLNLGQPFFRVGPQTGGTGLGLSIVKGCVSACRGTVLFRNRKGGGFEVELVLSSARQPVTTGLRSYLARRTSRPRVSSF